ncbi:MAG: leucine-rich repeat domain-containing protein [Promethearchaeota archaeon]
MNSNTADIDSDQESSQVLFCSACGLKFQPIKDKSKTLCPVCTNNYTKDPNFEVILLSLAYGHFMFNLGFRDHEVILRKAFKRVLEFKYWQSKKEQYHDYLDKNLEDLKEKLYNTIIFHEMGNEIKQMRNELDIKADKFDIFISHSWDGPENELVIPFVEALKESDYSIWFDKDLGLDPGDVKDYLKAAINDSKYCIPIFCKSYFEKENTLFELENILALKKKKNIFPLWFSDIDTDFLKSQGDLGKEALKCSAITWKNAGEDLNVVIKKLDEFIEASQEIEAYNGVKLYERDVNILKYFERIIGEEIPEVPSESKGIKFGFMHENLHLTGIFLKETSENKKVQPLHLPKEIFKLKTLRYLHAPLIDLPPQISQLENLIELDISGGIVSELPDLTPLKKLKKFEIKGCGILKCDRKTMDFCDKFFNWRKYNKNLNQDNAFYLGIMLREMDIDEEMPKIVFNNKNAGFKYSYDENGVITRIQINKKKINFLPETVTSFPKLQRLDLHDNQLSSIPESIGRLTNLKELDLEFNKLSSLPESIGRLINLKELNLGDNELSSLPESIGHLTNLKELRIFNNNLSYLPESIGPLKNLRYLYLQENKLSSLPESIGRLTNLEILILENNKLSSLPESIGRLTNLKELYLHGYQLSPLPEIITQMTWLKVLGIGGNQISSLPESIGHLTNLEILILENNKLSSLPKSIGRLTNLQKLDLEKNQLSSLPESIGRLNNLKELDLGDNELSPLPERIKAQLRNLKSHGCYIDGFNFKSN